MKILIVDDHQYNRELLAFMVEDQQHAYRMANNGKEALELVSSDQDIDLVLMDVNMPVMDGLEATREIKQQNQDRHLPVIFVTALDDDEMLSKCLAIGGDDFIPKPVNENVLLAKLVAHERTIAFHKELRDSNKELNYHRRVMDREHHIVETVFRNSMQRMERHCDNVNFHLSPVSMFNGDLLLVSPSPTGGIYVLLGDFTGHGLSAAVGCMPVTDIFYAMAKKRASISKIAREINAKLLEILPSNMFFCAAILELDVSGERLTVWLGGINDILLVDDAGNIKGRVQAQHMPLGVLSKDEFDDYTEIIKPVSGLRAYVYSDGVIEARNPQDELYGEERLEAFIRSNKGPCVEALAKEVETFHGGGEQTDDISIVEIFCQPVTFNHTKPETIHNNQSVDTSYEPALPWQVKLALTPEHLRCDNTIAQIVRLLASVESAKAHKDILFTVVSELFNNALEHGLLKLDSKIKEAEDGFQRYYKMRKERLDSLESGEILLQLQVMPGEVNRIKLTLTDSGEGFNTEAVIADADGNNDSYARGLLLVQSLCEQLHYTDGGRSATFTYALQ